MWNRDELRGKGDRIKGRMKESTGKIRGDEQLGNEGRADDAAGRIEETIGKGRRKLGKAINDLGNKVGR